ncbi:MAG: hypothetical protein EOO63_06250 [Hymenobacter sp.]|nr:MAG: hypothetical protein EOO63_06250 [Hymenobacter sp.]
MNFSATVCLRTPAQKNGLNTVRLQVILNRKVLFIPIGVAWPELLWDRDASRCLSKLPAGRKPPALLERFWALEALLGGDLASKAADYNLLIGQAVCHYLPAEQAPPHGRRVFARVQHRCLEGELPGLHAGPYRGAISAQSNHPQHL